MSSMMLTLAFLAASTFVQEPPKPQPKAPPAPPAPPAQKEEQELDVEEAMKILKDVSKLMDSAEELLNDASRGKALQNEKDLLAKIDKLLSSDPKENPSQAQQKILEKIQKLMQKAEGSEGESLEKMGEVIRRVKSAQGQGQPQPGPPQQQQQRQQAQKPDQPQSPATAPYDPNRLNDPINKFRSRGDRSGRWGDLPARLRESILSGKRELDDLPPEFQSQLKEYFKALTGEDR